jgi:HSP20 family molecular chaperone IbpA
LTGEYPPINVSRSDDMMIVDAACPGIERDKLEMTVVGESVSIRGEPKPEADRLKRLFASVCSSQ